MTKIVTEENLRFNDFDKKNELELNLLSLNGGGSPAKGRTHNLLS